MGRALMLQAGTKDFITTAGMIISTRTADAYEKSHRQDPGISYTYKVNGRTYLSHRDKFIRLVGDHSDDIVHQLPAGCLIEVFYDPVNPRNAVLVRGLESADIICAVILAVFNLLVLGFWSLPWFMFRHLKREGQWDFKN